MIEKAEAYLACAQSLINKRRFNDSVALSYYAALWYMRCALDRCTNNPIPYGEHGNLEEDLHMRVMEELKSRISNDKEGEKFKDIFMELKGWRFIADYEQQTIEQGDALSAKNDAEKLFSMIRRFFPEMQNRS